MMNRTYSKRVVSILLWSVLPFSVFSEEVPKGMVQVEAGEFVPLFSNEDAVSVPAFYLDVTPVTVENYLEFLRENPRWQRSNVPPIFADKAYLKDWTGDLSPPEGAKLKAPVTGVSWFAARAYSKWAGKRLPTTAEWEFAGRASETVVDGTADPAFKQRILQWYAKTTPKVRPEVQHVFKNVHGLWDMHGSVWEWVEDFNSALVTGESRGDSGLERNLFCGSASVGAIDPGDYAAFMRYALRSSLEAKYTTSNLGFRCAQTIDETKE
jgi:sulfatase modifying factor 1